MGFNKNRKSGKKPSGGIKRGTFRGVKGKQRDTFFKKKKDKAPKESAKRVFCFNRYRDKKYLEEELKKKQMLEEKLQNQYESESEEETQNPMQQLLSTFNSSQIKSKKSKAIDSSSDESSENEDQDTSHFDGNDEALDDDSNFEVEEDVQEELNSEEEVQEELNSEEEEHNDNLIEEEENELDMESDDDNTEITNTNEKNNGTELKTYVDENGDEVIQPGQDQAISADNDEEHSTNDPFILHLQNDIHDSLLESVTKQPLNLNKTSLRWSCLGTLLVQIPKSNQQMEKENNRNKVTILEEKQYTPCGSVPQKIHSVDLNSLCIKKQIQSQISRANKINLLRRDCELDEIFTPIQKELFSIINNYQDLYYSERSFMNAEEIRFVYTLHALNHLIKTRNKILHHNSKLSKKIEVPDEFRDQGLVRPKVIIVVPFKDAAYRIIKKLIELLVPDDPSQVVNKNRFEQEFTGGELVMPKKNPKPQDYELTFSGNTEDTFRIGLSITKKTLKLYTEFYSSDLIIASPLGLRVIVGAEGEEQRDFDFLASVELLIMDQTELFMMQNWDHLLHVLDHFHLQPKKTHGTDFSRLRSWAVNGWTKYYRQSLIFSSVALPEINAIFNKKCFNYAGKVKINNPVEIGSIRHVTVQVPQFFRRIDVKDPVSAIDARFEYFIKEILPQYKDTIMAHTMIYIPSYFDFVRIRNYFKKEDINFVQICEYSKDAKIARARDMFFHSEGHFLLYSERFHFFRRMRIKGIRHIIFYQPPVFPHFYSEMCNLMQEANQNKYGGSDSNMTITTIYTKYDLQQLSAVVSTDRTSKMCQSDRNVHMFMTGE